MRTVLAFLLLLLPASCVVAPDPENRVTVILRNSTGRPLKVQTQVGMLGRALEIPAGYTWRGWVPRKFVGREIFIEMIAPPPAEPVESATPEEDKPED